ncbi:zinc-ribbon domain-containing protein [Actinomycetospora straminea]|uniref:Treble clef zinc finger domain-containing protein n=1 Tax=Actinomycetospora straminea TaxID=663607 RepID=A0ABP9DWQ6_9PSEU|nr:zinc-ribbon domain-containing protein [Actinomycetospora straminea]MDD7934177.1 zinc-ribbon domain-containing protein [Actinomycetospora straminea]
MPRSLDPNRTLAARFPALAAQWHAERNGRGPARYAPDTILASSSAVVWWRCSEGHEWQDKVATRTGMPKWKNGDVAACPECIRSPTRLTVHTYPGCGHTLTVQRRNAEKDQQNCWDCGGDPDPAKDVARREHTRASALASYYRHKERGGLLSDKERAAQRALVGFLSRAAVEISYRGLTWWRDGALAETHRVTTTESLSAWLSALYVEHEIAIRRPRPGTHAAQIGVHVRRYEVYNLAQWAPTFVTNVEAAYSSVYSEL